jgi:succinate-semialdehyde dehydrogenase/glutarate-semialdehyde dehydrogenase
MSFQTVNPATGEAIRTYEFHDAAELRGRLDGARAAFREWSRVPLADRTALLAKVAAGLRENADRHAELMTREMGKPLAQAKAEVEKCAWACDYYVENAAAFLADEEVATDATKSYVSWRPLGSVLAIMPWNFPYWQVLRFAAPNVTAGNVGLLKHAEITTGCALAIEELFRDAGYPDGVFQALLIDHETTGRLIESADVQAVTLTGSTRAGRAVGEQAGRALKKVVLELGGSDPYLVLEDADLEAAAESCVASRMINAGQSCIAAKRFLVVESVRERFTELVVEKMRAKRMDDPTQDGVDLGPQARQDLRDELHDQVRRSVDAGATLALGGEVPDRAGAWYPPGVLCGVKPGTAAFDEELFGPVAAIVGVKDEAEGIRLANQSPYGLGAAVFTGDLERGERIARDELEAGSCFVNDFVKSDPRLPFGGIKDSGHGRELHLLGLREFLNAKTVVVK